MSGKKSLLGRPSCGDRGDEHDGVAHGDDDGAVGLAGDLAGLERDGVGAVLELDFL